jgi:hypothetical protein
MAFAQRSAEHGEVLREDVDKPAVDSSGTGNDAVSRERLRLHSEVDAIVLDVHVIFFEAALIEKDAETLAGGQPTLCMLRRNALFAAAELGRFTPIFELFDGGRQESLPGGRPFHGRFGASIVRAG